MALSLIQRRPSKILDDNWNTHDPEWDCVQQRLNTYGFILAGLVGDTEELHKAGENSISEHRLEQLLLRCQEVANAIEDLHRQFLEESPSPLFSPRVMPASVPGSTSSNGTELEFFSLDLAFTAMNFWALQLVLAFVIIELCAKVCQLEPDSPGVGLETLSDLASQLSRSFDSEICLQRAMNIAASVRFCLRNNMGAVGSLGSLLPLICAYWYSKYCGYEDVIGTTDLHRRLVEEKGILFVQNVAQDSPNIPSFIRVLSSTDSGGPTAH